MQKSDVNSLENNPVAEAIKERTKDYTYEGAILKKNLGKDVSINSYTEAKKLAMREYDDNVVNAFKENPQIYNVLHNATTKNDALDIVANSANDADLYKQFKDLLGSRDQKAVVVGDICRTNKTYQRTC